MKNIPFNVNAYAARLIGRENVSKLDGAILELVKNTYDADATICIIHYDKDSQTLLIADNGCGMTEDIIINNWMTIGNSTKVKNYHSEKGRVQTGAKGIGRFALDRISQRCEMFTSTINSNILWKVDWNKFENDKNITEITAELNDMNQLSIKEMLQRNYSELLEDEFIQQFRTGTAFVLSGLNDEWNNSTIDSIRQSLISLIPPNIENEFKIYLIEKGKSLDESLITPNRIDSYDYKITFKYTDKLGINTVIYRNEFDFGEEFSDVMSNSAFNEKDIEYFNGKPIENNMTISELVPGADLKTIESIGNFDGEFYFYKNTFTKADKEKFYYKDITGRKKYSDIFGGIKIYRDNFRIRPYGEAKSSSYDWLLLSNRKTSSPAALSHPIGSWRVAADQIYGNVNISRTNINLPDQSNREGIVETKAFKLLREIMIAIISLFEKDRQYVGRILSDYYKTKNSVEIYETEIIDNTNSNIKSEFIEKSKARIVIEEKDNIIQNLEEENKILMLLATSGIITNSYVHETKTAVHNIGMSLITAQEALEFDNNKEDAIKNIKEAIEYKETMNCWYKVTIDSISRDKRKMKKVDIYTLLSKHVESWSRNLKIQNIKINLSGDTNVNLKCYPYEIESIISNLITNSVAAFNAAGDKRIYIMLKEIENGIRLIYKDNGNGLAECYKKEPNKILEAFESDKRNENGELIGTGMGMWIVNKIVSSYNGKIDLSDNKTLEKGFKVEIDLYSY